MLVFASGSVWFSSQRPLNATSGQPLDAPVEVPWQALNQHAHVAAGADGFLAAWWELLCDTFPQQQALITARLDANGVEVPGSRREVVTEADSGGRATVAWDGERYRLAWTQKDVDGVGYVLRTLRIDAAGEPVDAAPQTLTTGPSDAVIECGTSVCLVAWVVQSFPTFTVRAVRLDRDGVQLDPPPFLSVTSGMSGRTVHAISSSGPDFMVATIEASTAKVTPVRGDGTVAGPGSTFSVGVSNGSAQLAWDGARHLVAWSSFGAINAQRLDTWATAVGAVVPVATPPAPSTLGLGFDGTRYVATWAEESGLDTNHFDFFAQRIATNDTLEGPRTLLASNQTSSGRIPPADGGVLIVSFHGQVHRLASDGTVIGGPGKLGIRTNQQTDPVVAFDGERFLVAWVDERQRGQFHNHVHALRYSRDGVPLDPAPLLLSDQGVWPRPIAIAAGAGQFAVIWTGSHQAKAIHGAFVPSNPDGAAVREFLVHPEAGTSKHELAIGFNGTDWLAAWVELNATPSPDQVKAARLRADGTADAPILLAEASNAFGATPRVSSPGGSWLTVWDHADGGVTERYGALISPDGVRGTPFLLGNGPVSADQAALANDGSDYLVVFAGGDRGVTGQRLLGSGATLDPTPFTIDGDTSADRPSLSWNGTEYVAAWTVTSADGGSRIRVAHVARDGTVREPGGVDVGATSPAASTVPVTSGPGARPLVVSTHRDAVERTCRLQLSRLVQDLDETCALDSDCATGVCEAGLCSATRPPNPERERLGYLIGCSAAHGGAPAPWLLVLLVLFVMRVGRSAARSVTHSGSGSAPRTPART